MRETLEIFFLTAHEYIPFNTVYKACPLDMYTCSRRQSDLSISQVFHSYSYLGF